MFVDRLPLINQISYEGFCKLYSEQKSFINLVYANPLMDYNPTLDDLREVLCDPNVKHLPIKRKRN